ncbi:homoserine dehydrogenase [Desulfovibrio inopinatus]|uniref:homoserine dehydrogenase n=1 Tax=Desulfovibrio inopinatus TaxID=102109 RepID=UPI00040BF807|nr:homoserine dehydrogenase [Desulfovibrio inopinatus]
MNNDPIRIGIAGLGTVGCGLATILDENDDWIARRLGRHIRIKTVAVRDTTKTRAWTPPSDVEVTRDCFTMAEDPEIDIVVELMGGIKTAHELITRSIRAGKHVVTANKALLAERGPELFALAAEHKRGLYYEASAAGGIPIVEALKEGLAGNRISGIVGILNGTANFILTEMADKGVCFQDALKGAQDRGFAEADPTFDIEGIDAAHKLVVLIRLAFGQDYPLARLPVKGISDIDPIDIEYARELGYEIKLIGRVVDEDGQLEAGVFPMLVKKTYLLAQVCGSFNAVRVEGNAVGAVLFQGKGAGARPTGSAVLADIMALVREGSCVNNLGFDDPSLPQANIMPPAMASRPHYFRFNVEDRAGVMAALSRVMGERDISIAQAVQKGEPKNGTVPIVFLTHGAREKDVAEALEEIGAMPFIMSPIVHLRVL